MVACQLHASLNAEPQVVAAAARLAGRATRQGTSTCAALAFVAVVRPADQRPREVRRSADGGGRRADEGPADDAPGRTTAGSPTREALALKDAGLVETFAPPTNAPGRSGATPTEAVRGADGVPAEAIGDDETMASTLSS